MDLTNLLSNSRPLSSSNKVEKEKKMVPRSTFQEEFLTEPPSPSTSTMTFKSNKHSKEGDTPLEETESFEYILSSLNIDEMNINRKRRITIGGGHNRECSTVLEESSSCLENEGNLVDPDESLGEGVEESFVTARDHALITIDTNPLTSTRPEFEDAKEEEEEEEEEKGSPTSRTSSFESTSREEIPTPDTSFPSTPGLDDPQAQTSASIHWLSSTPSKGNDLRDLTNLNFTPPKPPKFLEVVETCPTPEHYQYSEQVIPKASRKTVEQGDEEEEMIVHSSSSSSSPLERNPSEATRRRSLLKSSTLNSYAHYYPEEDEGEQGQRQVEPSWRYVSPTNSTLELNRSYTPSLIGGGGLGTQPNSTPSTPRRNRRREGRSRESTSGSTQSCRPVSPRTDLFPSISATELVVASLLSSASIASSSAVRQQGVHRYSSNSYHYDLSSSSPPLPPSSSPPPLLYTRPLSQSFNNSSSYSNRHHPSSCQPHNLLPKASSTTLFSYDLSHLPAPSTPLEKPFKVDWKDLIKPSQYLGGGKGSGKFGDRFGAVERRRLTTPKRSSGSSLWRVREDSSEVQEDGEMGRVDTPIPAAERGGRGGSIRRSLSRLSIRLNKSSTFRDFDLDKAVKEEEGKNSREEEIGEREGKIKRSQSIRKSLSRSLSTFSVTGRQQKRRDEEEMLRRKSEKLDQWINVIVT
ncbi:hypothetical protein JCM3765_003726 [Sporobolomyces pararoseus]